MAHKFLLLCKSITLFYLGTSLVSVTGCADNKPRKKNTAGVAGGDATGQQILSFSASPEIIPPGYAEKIMLTWQTQGIYRELELSEVGPVEPSGFRLVDAPTESRNYVLTVPSYRNSEPLQQQVTVTVESITTTEPTTISRDLKLPALGSYSVTERVIDRLDGSRNYHFQLGDFNGDGILDLYAMRPAIGEETSATLTILDGSKNYSTPLLDHADFKRSYYDNQNWDFSVFDYDSDPEKKPDVMVVKKGNTGTQKVEIFALSGKPETLGDYLLATGSAEIPVAESINGALVKTPDATIKPHVVLVGKNLESEDNLYSYRILDSRSVCTTDECKGSYMTKYLSFLYPNANSPSAPLKLLDPDSLYKFVTYDFNHDGTSDLIALRHKGSADKILEISVFDGASNFRTRLLEIGTQIAHMDSGEHLVFDSYDNSMAIFIFSRSAGKWVFSIYKL